MDYLQKYFPQAAESGIRTLHQFKDLVCNWNERINLMSRRDTDNIVERHLLPSLFLCRVATFNPGASFLDVGTGGGFPGMPLAILLNNCRFTLVDSVSKKTAALQDITNQLGVTNVTILNARAEQLDERFDYVLGRAVAALPDFIRLTRRLIRRGNSGSIPNGILYLTGGDVPAHQLPEKAGITIYNMNEVYEEEYFQTKKLVHIF